MVLRLRFGTLLIAATLAAGAGLYILGGAGGSFLTASILEPDDDPSAILRPSGAVCLLVIHSPTIPDDTRPRRVRTIVGRVVDEERRPIEGATVIGRFQNPLIPKIQRSFHYSEVAFMPSRPQRIRTQTDKAGRFQLTADPEGRGHFGLCIESEGFASARWSWNSSASLDVWPESGSRDLGDFELLPSGVLEGEVLDEVGQPLRRRLEVEFESSLSYGPTLRKFQPRRAFVNPETGKFRLPDCAPGAGRLSFTSGTLGPMLDIPVHVKPGGEVHVNPVVRDVPNSRDLAIVFRCDQGRSNLLTEELVLVKEDGTRSIPTTSDGPGATMKFEELDDDAFELRFTDPNFESVIRSGVRLSDDVLEIPLQGRGAVRVTALDARTGKPVPHVSIEVEDPIGAGDVLFTDLTPAEEIPPATSLFTGIALGAKAITVHAVGYSPATISIDPLTAGSVKPVEVRLERVVAPSPESPLEFIECTVVEADGKKPIRGARVVHCFIPDEQDEDGNRRSYESWTDMSLTDVDGNARWSRPGPGRFAFRFSGNRKYAESMSRSFVITDDLASASERVIASEGRTVRGKLTLPRGVSAAGHRVMLKLNGPVPPDLTDCVPDRPAWRDALTDADGSFVLRGVPAGTHRAYVLFAHGYSDGEAYFEERHQFPAGTLEVGRQDLDGVELGVGAEDIGGVEVSVEVEGKTSPEFARVHLISPNDSSIFRSFVNRDGLARFHALPPGSYRLVVDGVEGVDPFSVRDPVIAAWPPTRRSVKIDTR